MRGKCLGRLGSDQWTPAGATRSPFKTAWLIIVFRIETKFTERIIFQDWSLRCCLVLALFLETFSFSIHANIRRCYLKICYVFYFSPSIISLFVVLLYWVNFSYKFTEKTCFFFSWVLFAFSTNLMLVCQFLNQPFLNLWIAEKREELEAQRLLWQLWNMAENLVA